MAATVSWINVHMKSSKNVLHGLASEGVLQVVLHLADISAGSTGV